MATDTPDPILRIKAVLERTGLSRSTMYRKMQNGTFPRNVQISTRYAGWRASAVEAWMSTRCSTALTIIAGADASWRVLKAAT